MWMYQRLPHPIHPYTSTLHLHPYTSTHTPPPLHLHLYTSTPTTQPYTSTPTPQPYTPLPLQKHIDEIHTICGCIKVLPHPIHPIPPPYTSTLHIHPYTSTPQLPQKHIDDIHTICGCIKDFLRNLHEPIITLLLWQNFVDSASLYN